MGFHSAIKRNKTLLFAGKMLSMSSEINYTHIFILYVDRKVKQGFGSGSS